MAARGRDWTATPALAVLAVMGCDNEYPLAPTPCDEYCLVTQRAGCAEDWPDQCVGYCELSRSPAKYPACADRFEVVVGCYRSASSADFVCRFDQSEPKEGVCEGEARDLDFCIEPVYNRCRIFCEALGEHCEGVDVFDCLRGCSSERSRCEGERVRQLDCELSGEIGCTPNPSCILLYNEVYECFSAG